MRLLPRDEKFFDLLVEQTRIVLEASAVLSQGMAGNSARGNSRDIATRVRELERKGDEALHGIHRRLHKTFITPVDPEDIYQLSARIDDIIDHLDAVAYRFDAFELERSAQRMGEVALMVHGCIQSTVEALEALRSDGVEKSEELLKRCEEINQREVETENCVREAVRNLFRTERDPIALMKQKELYELLESTADCCENVADVLEAIAVKNS
jgi:uncharacterized protein Yka (UPF0111/DUF47 family)